MAPRPKVSTFLCFDDGAEEAARFYTSLFAECAIRSESRGGPGGLEPEGTRRTARFRLAAEGSRAGRVAAAMRTLGKLHLGRLEEAHDGR